MTLGADLAFVVEHTRRIGTVGTSVANVTCGADPAGAQVEEGGELAWSAVNAQVLKVVDGVVLHVCSRRTEGLDLRVLSADVSSSARGRLRRASRALVVNWAVIFLIVVEFVAVISTRAQFGCN